MPLDSQDDVIDHDIPVPPVRGGFKGKIGRVVDRMKIGDSLLVEKIGTNEKAFQDWARRYGCGIRFSSRKTHEGIRVWRVA